MSKRNKLRKQLESSIKHGWKTPFYDYLVFTIFSSIGGVFFAIAVWGIGVDPKIFLLISDDFFLKIYSVAISGILVFLIGSICLLLMKNRGKTMTCPRCIGKGFVDLNDIKRLGKEEDWIQGWCRYCDGNGEVIKGKTTLLSPIWTDDQIEDAEFDNWNDEEE